MKKIKDYPYCITPNGDVFSLHSERFIKDSLNNRGYHIVHLYDNGVCTTCLVHRLVAQAFISNPENKPCVNHIDGNKDNNTKSNLEWCTYSENNQHSFDTGLKFGKKGYTDEFVHIIFKMIMDGHRAKDIAEALDLTTGIVRSIIYEGVYDHIKVEYDFDNRPRKSATLNVDTVIKICKLLEQGKKYKDISDKTGVSVKKISCIKRRITYRLISESFNF